MPTSSEVLSCEVKQSLEFHERMKNLSQENIVKHHNLVQYCKLVDNLLEQVRVLEDALKAYAEGEGYRIKPEKAHLYDQDYPMWSKKWMQRSMCDSDSKILAKEALKQLAALRAEVEKMG